MPTTTASMCERQRCARSRDISPEIHLESPVAVATLPSSDMADLKSTHGRPVRACLRNAWLSSRARRATSPPAMSTSMPSSRRMPRPRPAACSAGSSAATTTRAMPAAVIAVVQGRSCPCGSTAPGRRRASRPRCRRHWRRWRSPRRAGRRRPRASPRRAPTRRVRGPRRRGGSGARGRGRCPRARRALQVLRVGVGEHWHVVQSGYVAHAPSRSLYTVMSGPGRE